MPVQRPPASRAVSEPFVRCGFGLALLAALTGAAAAQAGPSPPAAMPRAQGPLAAWIASRPHLGPNTLQTFLTPPQRVAAFGRFVEALASGDWSSARVMTRSLGYTVAAIEENGTWYVAAYDGSDRDATVVVNLAPSRDVVFEAPHVPFEAGTAEEAMLLLRSVGGRTALVSGAHRCASMTFAGCSGTTGVCDRTEPYRDSDVGHYIGTFFQAAHQALATRWPRSVSVSLHGMRDDTDGARTSLIVSSGAHGADPAMTLPATRLRGWLGRLQLAAGTVVSCNLPSDAQYGYRRLCGFTNVQGRLANGSADICSASAETATGRFVHLEQDWSVLQPYAEDWRNIGRYPLAVALSRGFIAATPPVP